MELSLAHLSQQLLDLKKLIQHQHGTPPPISAHERMILLQLSRSQIKTYLLMDSEREYTANDMATLTGNARAHESGILNQLARLNLLERRKHRKTIYFKKRA